MISLFGIGFASVVIPQPVQAAGGCMTSASTDSQATAQQACKEGYITECKKTYKKAFCDDLTVAQINKCATGTGNGLKANCMKPLETAWKPSTTASSGSSSGASSGTGCSSLDPTCTHTSGDCDEGSIENINKDNCTVISYIVIITNALSALVGVVIVTMIIIGGIQYSTAGPDPSKVQAARTKITNALLALVLFVFGFSILQWLIPGGIF